MALNSMKVAISAMNFAPIFEIDREFDSRFHLEFDSKFRL